MPIGDSMIRQFFGTQAINVQQYYCNLVQEFNYIYGGMLKYIGTLFIYIVHS